MDKGVGCCIVNLVANLLCMLLARIGGHYSRACGALFEEAIWVKMVPEALFVWVQHCTTLCLMLLL